jgi:hypothetical protein
LLGYGKVLKTGSWLLELGVSQLVFLLILFPVASKACGKITLFRYLEQWNADLLRVGKKPWNLEEYLSTCSLRMILSSKLEEKTFAMNQTMSSYLLGNEQHLVKPLHAHYVL